MRRIKLIRITTSPISLELLLEGQMKYMSNNGFDVIMVSGTGNNLQKLENQESVPHIILPLTRSITPINDLICLFKMVKLFRREKPDIVHSHTPKAGLIGMLASKIVGVDLKLHTMAGLFLINSTGVKRFILEMIERITMWGADYVLPNSKSILKIISDSGYTKDKKLSIIGHGSSNGIDLKRFSSENISHINILALKKKLDYNPSVKYIVAIGRLVRDKGIIELVSAFLYIQSNYEVNTKLVVVGELEDVRNDDNLPKFVIEAIQHNKDIILVGWSDEVEYYLSIANLFVHASHREGFPNVVLQSGAMECPIVCSNIPGNIDIVQHKKYGLLFEKGNVEDLINKINYALNNEEEMMNYSKCLRLKIEESFAREYVHSELLKFYNMKLADINS